MSGARSRIVVVGGGPAGLAAVQELGRAGYPGEVVVLTAEQSMPYDRTACSKGLLTGTKRPRDILLPRPHQDRVSWQLGVRAESLDPAAHVVHTSDGMAIDYDGLVIAPGTTPVTPPGWPHGAPGIHTLHGIDDIPGLLVSLRQANRVVVVGAGLTGCELAYAMRAIGRECILIDSGHQVLSHAVGARAGWLVTEQLMRDRITVRLERRFQSIGRGSHRWEIGLDDGDVVDADVVVAVLGERPATDWLGSSGLEVADGVLCDDALRVVGASGIVAAGSAARWPNGTPGPVRFGHWISALEQGRAAAQSLLAGDWRVPPVRLLRRYWTELGDLRIEVGGERPPQATEEVVLLNPGRTAIARGGVLIRYTVDDRLVGVVAVNAPTEFTTELRSSMVADAYR